MWGFIIQSPLIMWELIMLLHSAPLLYIYLIVSSRKSFFFLSKPKQYPGSMAPFVTLRNYMIGT